MKKLTKKKPAFLALTAAFLLIGSVLSLQKAGVISLFPDNPPTATTSDGISYGPPTAEEKRAGDGQKKQIADRENKVSAAENASNSTTVLITDAGQYDNTIEVRAFMPDYYKDGTCTIAITKGALKVEKSTSAYRDVSTTICTNPLFSRSEFAESGEWKVTVVFTSGSVSGKSEEKILRIN